MSLPLAWRPMPLMRIPEAFDHADWLYELKHDGFRALAHVDRNACRLVSRNGHVFGQWPHLCDELAHAVRARRAVLDGEIVCLQPDGRSDFHGLLFRRERPFFYAFDVLCIDGEDVRGLPLIERKARLRSVLPMAGTALRYVEHVAERGQELYRLACASDTEGMVAKWSRGLYRSDGLTTSWLKVKNPTYSQMEGRRELFERRRSTARGVVRATYRLDSQLTSRAW